MKWTWYFRPLFVLACLVLGAVKCSSNLQLLQVLYGIVGAENFTYYRLTRPGHLLLSLSSLRGDSDIYVSDKTQKPTYENYEQKSVTCGLDEVDISASMERPVGIGIYGYINSLESEYSLSIYQIKEEDVDYTSSYDSDSDGAQKPHNSLPHAPKTGEEDESLLWTIFVNILKIIVDVLL